MNAAKNDSNRLFYIATGKFVACLDRASGEIAWQTELMRNLLTANMVFDGERIIVAQPVSHVVGGGNAARTVVKENIQYPG